MSKGLIFQKEDEEDVDFKIGLSSGGFLIYVTQKTKLRLTKICRNFSNSPQKFLDFFNFPVIIKQMRLKSKNRNKEEYGE